MRKLVPGVNDLATVNPELAAEWHPTKNGELQPNSLLCGSNKDVWWRCPMCGHEWIAKPVTRSKGHGCAVCGHKKAAQARSRRSASGRNSIAEKNPSLTQEWDYDQNPSDRNPQNVSPWSNQEYYWICPDCHTSYLSSVTNRTSGQGCPVCAGKNRRISRRRTEVGLKGSLSELMPELAAEWNYEKNAQQYLLRPTHPSTPQEVTPGSKAKVWWRCTKGHEYPAVVYSRKSGTGCPICDMERKSSFPEQVVYFYLKQVTSAVNHHKLSKNYELDIYLPEHRIGIEYDGEAWHRNSKKDIAKNQLCAEAGIRLIRIREPGCPAVPGECIFLPSCSLEDLRNAVLNICAMIHKSVDVDIERDRIAIYELFVGNENIQSFAAQYPDAASEWHPTRNNSLTPEGIAPKSNKSFWWICLKGHEYPAKASERARGRGCPYCAGKKVLPGFNDLASQNPSVAAEWHPSKNGDLLPSQVTACSHDKAWWQCAEGHEWEAEIKSRHRGNNCPYCSGRLVIPGKTDLATNNPILAKEWHPTKNGDFSPENTAKTSNKKVWWICPTCGFEYQARISDRNGNARHQTGCPRCAEK